MIQLVCVSFVAVAGVCHESYHMFRTFVDYERYKHCDMHRAHTHFVPHTCSVRSYIHTCVCVLLCICQHRHSLNTIHLRWTNTGLATHTAVHFSLRSHLQSKFNTRIAWMLSRNCVFICWIEQICNLAPHFHRFTASRSVCIFVHPIRKVCDIRVFSNAMFIHIHRVVVAILMCSFNEWHQLIPQQLSN